MIQGLSKRTKEQKEDMIKSLSKKPIKELWAQGAIISAEQKHVLDLFIKASKGHNYKEIEKLEKRSIELAEQETDLKEAIRKK